VENNYDPNIPKWVDVNYPKTFMYDDTWVTILEETLPIQTNHKNKRIKRKRRNLERKSYDFEDSAKLAQFFLEHAFFVKLKDMLL
jgi:hypothetical protein